MQSSVPEKGGAETRLIQHHVSQAAPSVLEKNEERGPPDATRPAHCRHVKKLFQDAGLNLHEDPTGNILRRTEGYHRSAGATPLPFP